MGCFLACFGTSKDGRRRKHRHKLHPGHYHQRIPLQPPLQSGSPASKQENSVEPVNPVLDTREEKEEEQLSVFTRKRVTFDSNVVTYEHVSLGESQDFLVENGGGVKKEEEKEKEKEEILVEAKPSQSHSQSEDSSITSGSSGSYPTNHRYHSCRESDDELDAFEASDVNDDFDADDDDDFDDDDEEGVVDSVDGPAFACLRARDGIVEEVDYGYEVESEVLRKRELSGGQNMRDRAAYMHPVLNPVENITQWKAVKTKGAALTNNQKENLKLDEEPQIPFSSEPTFRESSLSFKGGKPRQVKKSTNSDMDVDASLSTWLGSSEYSRRPAMAGPVNMGTPEKSMSCGSSNSPRSFDDRPILGALTLDEIKQFSVTSSPRKSPSHSPDEMPIIGSVGTFWNNSGSSKDSVTVPSISGSSKDSVTVPSIKGIPNTTSKYREDKKVNWHSTPFETRLERALNGGAT